jgi:hypothetical protein
MGWWPAIVLAALAAGCSVDSVSYKTELPADGVTSVVADAERGSFVYDGDGEADTFGIEVTSWAVGVLRGDARKQRKQNLWSAEPDGTSLDLWARSQSLTAGVDFEVHGPSAMDLDVSLREGDAVVNDVAGVTTLTANHISAWNLDGSADLYAAEKGMDVRITPSGDDPYVLLESVGDVYLELPYGTPMQLLVFADPQWGVTVTDLGFDALHVQPDYVAAESGEGTTQVEVWVSGGRFTLGASPP